MIRMKIGLDWDDTFAPFNSIACNMANEDLKISPGLSIDDVTSWENAGRASVIKKYYSEKELYERQLKSVSPENVHLVKELMKLADVYFISAVYPDFMSTRARQIKTIFPELPNDRIILGGAKNLVQFDVILDDNINNVLSSPAEYPVLMRKPWNSEMTGLLSVNNLNEFVLLVKHIIEVSTNKIVEITEPTVVALVGPSGAGKNRIADYMTGDFKFVRPLCYTTNPNADDSDHKFIPEEYFNKEDFFESTMYAGYAYGTKEEEIEKWLNGGFNVVLPLDMCGAIGMKKKFRTVIFYIDNKKEELIKNILRSDMDEREKTLRILSLDAEHKNSALADIVICNDGTATDKILSYFEGGKHED